MVHTYFAEQNNISSLDLKLFCALLSQIWQSRSLSTPSRKFLSGKFCYLSLFWLCKFVQRSTGLRLQIMTSDEDFPAHRFVSPERGLGMWALPAYAAISRWIYALAPCKWWATWIKVQCNGHVMAVRQRRVLTFGWKSPRCGFYPSGCIPAGTTINYPNQHCALSTIILRNNSVKFVFMSWKHWMFFHNIAQFWCWWMATSVIFMNNGRHCTWCWATHPSGE